jgi:hypothetical protein
LRQTVGIKIKIRIKIKILGLITDYRSLTTLFPEP